MSKPIGIGFIGAGGNTRLRHLPGFAAIDGVRLVTVANRSEASSRAVAEAFGIERTAPDWRAVIGDPEVDAICIGTWPYLHAEISVTALAAGKHVLTEARMAANLAEAQAMLGAAQAHPELVAQVVPSPFTLDLDSTVMGLLRSGQLGDIREVFIDHSHGAFVNPEAPLTWRQDPAYSGINMLTLGIYHEITNRWFPDSCAVEHVSGAVFSKQRRHWETDEVASVRLPDCLHILGRMERGALLNYHFSAVEPGPGRNTIKLVGSAATLRIEVGSGQLFISGKDGQERLIEIPEGERRGWRVEADFIESIRNGEPVKLTSFSDGLRYMEFTEAVYSRLAL
ncbi:MAG TPA: Gfo/Idh/MocA family oxidoreductase [Oceanipulchritudo sp.]|nr:Gfo/Idh/MocA family oxidoreductase [Oceanipulchritudo sp.]